MAGPALQSSQIRPPSSSLLSSPDSPASPSSSRKPICSRGWAAVPGVLLPSPSAGSVGRMPLQPKSLSLRRSLRAGRLPAQAPCGGKNELTDALPRSPPSAQPAPCRRDSVYKDRLFSRWTFGATTPPGTVDGSVASASAAATTDFAASALASIAAAVATGTESRGVSGPWGQGLRRAGWPPGESEGDATRSSAPAEKVVDTPKEPPPPFECAGATGKEAGKGIPVVPRNRRLPRLTFLSMRHPAKANTRSSSSCAVKCAALSEFGHGILHLNILTIFPDAACESIPS